MEVSLYLTQSPSILYGDDHKGKLLRIIIAGTQRKASVKLTSQRQAVLCLARGRSFASHEAISLYSIFAESDFNMLKPDSLSVSFSF
ncbi:hypothetical protein, partial [Bacillus sp. EB01]|uniref:hypothetical protein n=1 Tax=Bacillus sp. EB01 TaxID=1347086 RepID=UPI001E3682DC